MQIVGYADRFSAQPGDTIRFMVSSKHPTYHADIVKLIHGDLNPEGPGFKEEPVKTEVDGDYAGQFQELVTGSYAIISDHQLLRRSGSFTLQAWIYPTTPSNGAQGILTKWSAPDGSGYGLMLDDDGGLALWLGFADGRVERVGTGKPMRAKSWYFVAGSYDASTGKVSLHQQPLSMWPRDDTAAVVDRTVAAGNVGENDVPFIMAGYYAGDESGRVRVDGSYNGKIEQPALFGRALSQDEIGSLRRGAPPSQLSGDPVAAWDFARDFSSDTVTDSSVNGLHGNTVNRPTRAMTGHNWTGKHNNFNNIPEEYAVIYFHDDDLDDAQWDVSFELKVPDGLKSGVYAARLTSGDDEDYVPFFVRPGKGATPATILFVAPTVSYLAYANFHRYEFPNLGDSSADTFEFPVSLQDRYVMENNLHSLYDVHSDGSGVAYSSRLRPILTMRPKYNFLIPSIQSTGEGAPWQLNADLHLIDWLESKGYDYDVVTDEDIQLEGADLLAPYRAVLSGSHPEYYSGQMLDALETYLAGGGRYMYLGGNGYYCVTSFEPDSPHCVEVRRCEGSKPWAAAPGEYHHSTTGEPGGLWRHRGRAPQRLFGVGYIAPGFDYSLPYQRLPDSFDPRAAFIFEGIGSDEPIGDFGLVQDAAGGVEIDRVDFDLGTPPHALVLATCTGFTDNYLIAVEEELVALGALAGGSQNPLIRGDMVFFEGPNGGGVFSVGSISWCGSLSHNNYDNNVSRITDNVLKRFASDASLG